VTLMSEREERRQFARDHDSSVMRKAERGVMPKGIDGLVHWYIGALSEELPDRLHKGELWHDGVSPSEREEGVRPQGGSLLGTPAWDGTFRALLEGSPSTIDEDGYYRFPVHAALSRMTRREAWMAQDLWELARREGDWRGMAKACLCHPQRFEVYITEALRRLWLGCHDQSVRRMT
jgi:hypothetical protein